MADMLIICPTIRKERVIKMFSSVLETSDADIIFSSEVGSITKLVNDIYNKCPYYSFYHLTNDDFIYRTNNWHKILMQKIIDNGGHGISYGNDLYSPGAIPTAPVISNKILKALGYIQLPTLTHLCNDLVLSYIGRCINKIYYCQDVIIEHEHFLANKSEKDSVYEKTNSEEMYEKDNAEFRRWRKENSESDIQRVRLAMSQV